MTIAHRLATAAAFILLYAIVFTFPAPAPACVEPTANWQELTSIGGKLCMVR